MSVDIEDWAPHLADDLTRVGREAELYLKPEAERLGDIVRRYAPRASGALRKSILARGLSVLSTVDYAELQDQGGTVKAVKHGWLTIPVRPGYVPGPNHTTVRGRDGHQYVVRSGTLEVWAVRRREVRIRGSRFLERALSAHLEHADERVADRLIAEVTP